jgi:hypothetical protein
MLSCGVQRVLAFIFAVFSLCTFINLPIWPHISHFCIIVTITGIIIAKYQHTYTAKFAVMSFALMICAYARPELFLAFLPVFLLTYLSFILNLKSQTKKEIILVISLTLLSLLVYRFFRTPFNNGDSQRGIGVFLQHFALNYSSWHPTKSPFWLDFFDVFYKEFKGATPTLSGLYSKNPDLIQQHFISNITNYFIQLIKIIVSFFTPIFTKETHWLTLMICIMLFIVYFSFTKSLQNTFKRLNVLLFNNIFTLTILGVFAIPSLIVCIYAYPRDHYLLIQVPFLLLIVSLFASSIQVTIVKPIQKIIVISTIWFFVMPAAEDFDYFSFNRFNYYSSVNDYANLPNLTTIKYLKKNMLTKDSVCIFDLEGGIANLLPNNYTNNLYKWKRDSVNLSSFILSSPDIDLIYYTPTMTNLNCTQKDTTLLDLLVHPDKYGYYKQKTGNFKQFLLVKQN